MKTKKVLNQKKALDKKELAHIKIIKFIFLFIITVAGCNSYPNNYVEKTFDGAKLSFFVPQYLDSFNFHSQTKFNQLDNLKKSYSFVSLPDSFSGIFININALTKESLNLYDSTKKIRKKIKYLHENADFHESRIKEINGRKFISIKFSIPYPDTFVYNSRIIKYDSSLISFNINYKKNSKIGKKLRFDKQKIFNSIKIHSSSFLTWFY